MFLINKKIEFLGSLDFEWSSGYIVVCLLIGALYALFLYYRDAGWVNENRLKVGFLAFLRFLVVSALAILLLGPIFRSITKRINKPTVLIFQDASTSVKKDNQTIALLDSLQSRLSDSYDVEAFHFSDVVKNNLADSCTGSSTNVSSVFAFIDETFANQNIGAILMSTDGIYNAGVNPIYQKGNASAPLYIIAQGDTTARKDIRINQVFHNKIVFLGDKFSLQVDVEGTNMDGETSQLILRQGGSKGQRIEATSVSFNSNKDFKTLHFEVPANRVGTERYSLELRALKGEVSSKNNYKEFFVEVLDAKQKVLILANAPHPDIGALRGLVSIQKNYEVSVALASSKIPDVQDYDLVILHNLPSKRHGITQTLRLLEQLNKSTWFVSGSQINKNAFNRAQNILNIRASAESFNEVTPSYLSSFSAFKIDEDVIDDLVNYPPLKAPFGNYQLLPTGNALLNQKIGKVGTDYPLLAFSETKGRRMAVLTGEGVWKWRLNNYQKYGDFDRVSSLFQKIIQYLTIKEDKRKFQVDAGKRIYNEAEKVIIEAELFNDAYELVNEPDVNIRIFNEAKKEYPFTCSKYLSYYQLDAGAFPPGKYKFIGSTSYGGQSYTADGQFTVKASFLEDESVTANHRMLTVLAEQSNGSLVLPSAAAAQQIIDLIESKTPIKPTIDFGTKKQTILHYKWIGLLLVVLLFLEWFLRRLFGSY